MKGYTQGAREQSTIYEVKRHLESFLIQKHATMLSHRVPWYEDVFALPRCGQCGMRAAGLRARARARRCGWSSVRVVTRAGRAGGRVPRMPHVPPQVLPHLTLGGRLSPHPDRTSCCGAVWASVLVVNLSAGRTCSWSAIDGSRTPARDRRRDGLGTFACAAAFDRNATSATPARAR